MPGISEEYVRLGIGRTADDLGELHFKGLIDEVKIWGRVLNEDEIMAEYEEQSTDITPSEDTIPDVPVSCDPPCGECQDCVDGVCLDIEDCQTDCVGFGGTTQSDSPDVCCPGLIPIADSVEEEDGSCSDPTGTYYCASCGSNGCEYPLENDCNCFDCEEISGCTDPMALNYDPDASSDDGSCILDCITEGNLGLMSLNDQCCTGLTEIVNEVKQDDTCIELNADSFYCTECGDGECVSPENECNCDDCVSQPPVPPAPPEPPRKYGTFVFLDSDRTYMIDAEEQEYVGIFEFDTPDEGYFSYGKMALSKDGKYIYVISDSSYIGEIDVKEGSLIRTFRVWGDDVSFLGPLTVSPDGQYLYISSGATYSKILKVNLETEDYQVLYQKEPGEILQIFDLETSTDGSFLYVIPGVGEIYKIDTTTGDLWTPLDMPQGGYGQGCFVKDNFLDHDFLYHVNTRGYYIHTFNLLTGQLTDTLVTGLADEFKFISDIVMGPNGEFYLAEWGQTSSNNVYIINGATGEIESTIDMPVVSPGGFRYLEIGETWGQTIDCGDVSPVGTVFCYIEEGAHEDDVVDGIDYWIE